MNVMHVRGGEAFAESMDRFRINFLVSLFNRAAPKQKNIIVDERDVRIFKDLYYNLKDHKNIVAIVNQWHMEGIETHWRNHTGTVIPKENLSPVADMPIDDMQEKLLTNEWLRRIPQRSVKLSRLPGRITSPTITKKTTKTSVPGTLTTILTRTFPNPEKSPNIITIDPLSDLKYDI